MSGRRRAGLAEDLINLAAMLPWWLGVALSVLAYLFLHHFAAAEVAITAQPQQAAQLALDQLGKSLASIGQYIVPLLLLAGAAASALGRQRRKKLVAEVSGSLDGAALRSMSWRDFERLVGEAFRLRGYSVIETGGGGADGGVDLRLRRGSETYLVQCKQWKAYMVSVKVVRELYGVMAAQGATGGFVVCSGVFTPEARAFVQGRNIELIDGAELKRMIDGAQEARAAGDRRPRSGVDAASAQPSCPRCGSAMIKRMAKAGAHAGREFWGCTAYPNCRGTRPIE